MSDVLKKTRDAYDGLASTYDQVNESNQGIMDELNSFLHALVGDIIFDAGCGHGRDSAFFTDKGLKAIGVDISKELIRIAKEKSKESFFILGDMRFPPIKDKVCNGLWVCASFHHLERKDAPAAMCRLYETISNHGLMHLSLKKVDFTGHEEGNRYGGDRRFYSYYSDEEVKDIVSDSGFKILSQDKHLHETIYRRWINILAEKRML